MALPQIRSGLPWGQQAITLINNAIGKIVDASTTVAGLVKLATNSDTVTGTATDTATTPAGVKAATDAVVTALLADDNTWTAAQTISVTGNAQITMIGTNSGLVRLQDTGATDDSEIFDIQSDGGSLLLRSRNNDGSSKVVVMTLDSAGGVTIGSPTGGNKGAGTLNLDNDLYKDGTKVVGARKTGWSTATGTASRATFDTATVTTAQLAQRVKALIDDLEATAGHGLIGS